MKYNVIKNGEVVKKNLSKKQAEEYCEKMNQEFMDSQEEIQKRKQKSGLPLKKSKYELYKVEVVKENVIKLTESDLARIVKQVIDNKKTVKEEINTMIGNDNFLNNPIMIALATAWLLNGGYKSMSVHNVMSYPKGMMDGFLEYCNSMGYSIDKEVLDMKFKELINKVTTILGLKEK